MSGEERAVGAADVVRCPECEHGIRAEPGYVTWCDRCEWNVDPHQEAYPYPRWRQRLEHRLADALYRELERDRINRPGWDAARVVAYILSGLVLLLPVVCVAAGVAVLLYFRPLWLAVPIAVIPLAGAWLFRPRAARLHPEAQILTRDQAPRLYHLLDQLAAAVATDPVHTVVLSTDANLWFARAGWRRRPVVGIGLPFWMMLAPQERVAILAHELGHGRNGDARHSWVVGMAETVLDELLVTFSEQPLDAWRRELGYHVNAGDQEVMVNSVTRIVNATVGRLVLGYAWLLSRADLRSSQRAEYLADRKAAQIAGSEAAARALERSVLAETAYRAMEKALRFDKDADPLTAARQASAAVPASELDRRLRVSRLRETRTDSTHPPTYLRSKLIRARPAPTARVVLGLDDSATIDRELAAAGAPVLDDLRRSFPA